MNNIPSSFIKNQSLHDINFFNRKEDSTKKSDDSNGPENAVVSKNNECKNTETVNNYDTSETLSQTVNEVKLSEKNDIGPSDSSNNTETLHFTMKGSDQNSSFDNTSNINEVTNISCGSKNKSENKNFLNKWIRNEGSKRSSDGESSYVNNKSKRNVFIFFLCLSFIVCHALVIYILALAVNLFYNYYYH